MDKPFLPEGPAHKKRIQEAPPYDPDVAIPREYETRLHDYYGYPYYWQ